jgi:hypothetical protein
MGIRLRRLRITKPLDHLVSTAPIYKVSLDGKYELVGSGFWVTSHGHLITAWHVIADNIGQDGVDRGPIYAMQTLPNRNAVPRVLRQTHRHDTFDLALSETLAADDDIPPTVAPVITLQEPMIGSRVYTYAFLSPAQNFEGEKSPGVSTATFAGRAAIPDYGVEYDLAYMARIGFGNVTQMFPDGRDSVMLPFPCFQSDIPVYGANSGGPVFDEKGRICGINCTSYEGSDISFHAPLTGILDLWARDIEFIPEDPVPRRRSVLELGLARRALFDPPLQEVFYSLRQRLLLWPYHRYLECVSWLRWGLYQAALKVIPEAARKNAGLE